MHKLTRLALVGIFMALLGATTQLWASQPIYSTENWGNGCLDASLVNAIIARLSSAGCVVTDKPQVQPQSQYQNQSWLTSLCSQQIAALQAKKCRAATS